MTFSYKSRAEATDDLACRELMREAFNAAHNAVRLDESRLWTVRGSCGYVSTWGDTATAGPDGQTWALTVGSKTPRRWTFARQRLAAFPGLAQVTEDGDEEGVFRLMRLPAPEMRRAPGSGSLHHRPPPEGVSPAQKWGIRPLPFVLASGRYPPISSTPMGAQHD
jgi:hypothetical protein